MRLFFFFNCKLLFLFLSEFCSDLVQIMFFVNDPCTFLFFIRNREVDHKKSHNDQYFWFLYSSYEIHILFETVYMNDLKLKKIHVFTHCTFKD